MHAYKAKYDNNLHQKQKEQLEAKRRQMEKMKDGPEKEAVSRQPQAVPAASIVRSSICGFDHHFMRIIFIIYRYRYVNEVQVNKVFVHFGPNTACMAACRRRVWQRRAN